MSDLIEVRIPDMGDVDAVEVVEILVQVGDAVDAEASLVTLESDKASMDVPSPRAGVVKELELSSGDTVKEGDLVLLLEAAGDASPGAPAPASEDAPASEETARSEPQAPEPEVPAPADARPAAPAPRPPESTPAPAAPSTGALPPVDEAAFADAYASPSVRKLARELGADLGAVEGTGRKGRITDGDLKAWVKAALHSRVAAGGGGGVSGFDWPAMPAVDFSKFGDIEEKPLSRIQKVSKKNLHRSWLHVPHVTQHDEADTTELEAFRQAHKDEAKKRGFSLT
ncbi:MAG: biotin/lipoyl-containing protein, partial [Acidobacteriota bacterium]